MNLVDLAKQGPTGHFHGEISRYTVDISNTDLDVKNSLASVNFHQNIY